MSSKSFPGCILEFREENPDATVWVLKKTGFEPVPPEAEWRPSVVRFQHPRPIIARWLELARAQIWHLSRETGWRLFYSAEHTESGIGIAAWLLPGDDEFIGPMMNIGPAFMLDEQQYLGNLAEKLSCEALLLRGGL